MHKKRFNFVNVSVFLIKQNIVTSSQILKSIDALDPLDALDE